MLLYSSLFHYTYSSMIATFDDDYHRFPHRETVLAEIEQNLLHSSASAIITKQHNNHYYFSLNTLKL